jgi:hypothetical protein
MGERINSQKKLSWSPKAQQTETLLFQRRPFSGENQTENQTENQPDVDLTDTPDIQNKNSSFNFNFLNIPLYTPSGSGAIQQKEETEDSLATKDTGLQMQPDDRVIPHKKSLQLEENEPIQASSEKIEATVNLSKVVANGKGLKPSEIGRILEPILKAAEQEYLNNLRSNRIVAERQQKAQKKISNKEEVGFLANDEQRLLFGSAESWAREKQGVRLNDGNWVQIGNPSNPAELKVNMNQNTTYPSLLRSLQRLQRQTGLSDSDIATLLSSKDSSTLGSKLNELKGKVAPDKRDLLDARATRKLLMGIATLTQSIEPIRRPGVATAHSLAFTFVEGGDGALKDIMGRTGKWAPMTPIGASSKQDNRKTRTAELYRYRRIGNLFAHLLEQTQKTDIFVKQSGYSLKRLANAVQAWLNEKFDSKEDADELVSKEAVLKAEIGLLLQSYHGR